MDRALTRLRRAADKLSKLDADRESAMRERDEALRAAQAVRATYAQMQEAGRVSQVTISKALRRQ